MRFNLLDIDVEKSGLLEKRPKNSCFDRKIGFGKYKNSTLLEIVLYNPDYFKWIVENVDEWATKNLKIGDIEFIQEVFAYQATHHRKMMSYVGGVSNPCDDWDMDGGRRY